MRASQIALSAIVALYVTSAVAQSSPPATLKKQLDAIATGTTRTLGYSLHHLKTGDRLDRLGDELFPTDSTLKVAIMAAAMERVVSGKQPYGAGIYVLTIFAQGGADPKPSWQDEVSTSIRAISKAVWRISAESRPFLRSRLEAVLNRRHRLRAVENVPGLRLEPAFFDLFAPL